MVWKFHANWLYSVISLIFTTCCREVPKQTHDDDGLERAICIENKIEFREMSASARAIGIRVCMRHVLAKFASCIVHVTDVWALTAHRSSIKAMEWKLHNMLRIYLYMRAVSSEHDDVGPQNAPRNCVCGNG